MVYSPLIFIISPTYLARPPYSPTPPDVSYSKTHRISHPLEKVFSHRGILSPIIFGDIYSMQRVMDRKLLWKLLKLKLIFSFFLVFFEFFGVGLKFRFHSLHRPE